MVALTAPWELPRDVAASAEQPPAPVTAALRRAQAEYAKLRLMCCVAGLDRGFAASKAAAREVEAAVQALVSAGGPVDLLAASGEPGLLGFC